MKDRLKQLLASSLASSGQIDQPTAYRLLEKPKQDSHGDLAFPCFEIAKRLKKNPKDLAIELASNLTLPAGFDHAQAVGPFVNFHFTREIFIRDTLENILSEKFSKNAQSEKVVLEYSSPNIAKPFHVGHLRATLIGNVLDKVYRFLGYQVVSVNHLGDWGTQFGFVWAGCELWGKPQDPTVEALVELYKRATTLKDNQENNTVSESDQKFPEINTLARKYFVDLEQGEAYAVEFWQWCLAISLQYFKQTYARLGISFDHYTGESFYSDKLDSVKETLNAAKILKESEGAFGVDLGEKLGFARVYTADGRSLYLTRDLATAEYRAKEFKFDRSIYVVGAPQTLHFQQIIEILKRLGRSYAEKITHVPFGLVLGVKTRGAGDTIELNELLDEAQSRALKAYHDQVSKRPDGLDEHVVAWGVGVSALIFGMLSKSRIKDVQFNWDQALQFQGDTGPYVLYACARVTGIKEKVTIDIAGAVKAQFLVDDTAYSLAKLLADFIPTLRLVTIEHEPAILANYLLDVAHAFSKAYLELKVLGVDAETAKARLQLFEATAKVLTQGLELMGMVPLQRM
ncbi:arginine--tRNA ligase [bacterium]|nr:arginine--tRNA ligase [bacterium]